MCARACVKQRPTESHRSGLTSPAVKGAAPVAWCHLAPWSRARADVHESNAGRQRLQINNECDTLHCSVAAATWQRQRLFLDVKLKNLKCATVSSTITALGIKSCWFRGCRGHRPFDTGVPMCKNAALSRWFYCERAFPEASRVVWPKLNYTSQWFSWAGILTDWFCFSKLVVLTNSAGARFLNSFYSYCAALKSYIKLTVQMNSSVLMAAF